MKKVYKITEAQLKKIVSRVLNEDFEPVPTEGGGSTKPSSTPMSKSDIEKLQTALSKSEFASYLTKYTNLNNGIDGKFGKGTRAALAAVQAKNKITGETNTIGPLTKKALNFDTIVVKPTTPAAPKTSKEKTSSLAYIVFNGKTLNWVENGRVVKQWNAWSGRTKWNALSPYQRELAAKLTKLEFMKVKEQGPTPQGNYTISSIQARTNGNSLKLCGNKTWEQLGKMYDDDYTKNGDTHNFSSFYLHGGGIAGSIGCIDLVDRIDDFVHYYTGYLSKTGAKGMDLIVDYSNKVNLDTTVKIPEMPISSTKNVGDKRGELEKNWDDLNSPENRGRLYKFN